MFCVTVWHEASFLGIKNFFVPGSRNIIQLFCRPLNLFHVTMWNVISGKLYNVKVVNVRSRQDQREDKRSKSFNAFFHTCDNVNCTICGRFSFSSQKFVLVSCGRRKTERQIYFYSLSTPQPREVSKMMKGWMNGWMDGWPAFYLPMLLENFTHGKHLGEAIKKPGWLLFCCWLCFWLFSFNLPDSVRRSN